MQKIRHITFTVFSEEEQKALTIRLPSVIFYLFLGLLIASLIGLVISIIYSSMLSSRTATFEAIKIENEKLKSYTSKISLLENELEQNRILTIKLAKMAGVDLPGEFMNSESGPRLGLTRSAESPTNLSTKSNEVPQFNYNANRPSVKPDNEGSTSIKPREKLPQTDPARELKTSAQATNLLLSPSGKADLRDQESGHSQSIEKYLANKPVGYPVSKRIKTQTIDSLKPERSVIEIITRPEIPIRATADGTIEFSGSDSLWGNTIVISHTNQAKTIYSKVGRLRISKGQKVRKDQIIGYTPQADSNGNSIIYYEIKKNSP